MNELKRNNFGERVMRISFFLLIAFLLYPLITLTYIVSHDGPSHIYNAGIIRQILGGNTLVNDFLILKKFPEPNWTGHFILIVLSSVFRPDVADKIFLGCYIVLFPLFFLYLLRKINPNSTALSFLVIPFVYSIFLFLGVYNFLAGVTILILALAFVLPKINIGGKSLFNRVLIFSLLLYFSHLLALGVFMIVVATALVFSWLETKNVRRREFINHIAVLSLAFLPVLFLTLFFFYHKLSLPSKPSNVSIAEMLDFLWHIRFAITLTYSPEDIYAIALFGMFALLLLIWIFTNISGKDKRNLPFYRGYKFWLTCTLLMLACYFIIPDEAASGGVVKFRFLLIFYLFLTAFLSVIDFPRIVNYAVVLFICMWTVLKLNYLYPMMKQLNKEAVELMKVTENMKSNSLLLPLNYSTNWIHDNLSNYAGTRNNIFVLDNYEANTPHFPIEWKKDRSPILIMGEFTGYVPLCADINKFELKTHRQIDYVLIWRPQQLTDSCSNAINDYLSKNYKLVVDESGAQLFQLKSK